MKLGLTQRYLVLESNAKADATMVYSRLFQAQKMSPAMRSRRSACDNWRLCYQKKNKFISICRILMDFGVDKCRKACHSATHERGTLQIVRSSQEVFKNIPRQVSSYLSAVRQSIRCSILLCIRKNSVSPNFICRSRHIFDRRRMTRGIVSSLPLYRRLFALMRGACALRALPPSLFPRCLSIMHILPQHHIEYFVGRCSGIHVRLLKMGSKDFNKVPNWDSLCLRKEDSTSNRQLLYGD